MRTYESQGFCSAARVGTFVVNRSQVIESPAGSVERIETLAKKINWMSPWEIYR